MAEKQVYSQVPAKISPWTSFKSYMLKPIVVELTPHQKKIFQEVRDFLNQEVVCEHGEVFLRKAQPDGADIKVSL